ncbi:MAG: glycosyltransferase family 8 protein [Lachnospiraceae bacterium]|nr:glycosyltransferase family 8 protein [Lachnospiraceae bacterium]
MNIAVAFNKKYLNFAVVMLTSFLENNKEDNSIFIFNNELDSADFAFLRKSLVKYEPTFYDIKISLSDNIWKKLPVTNEWSREVYYRLLIPDRINKDLERILYLDIDLIVHASIKEFYYADFEDSEIISVRDTNGCNSFAVLSEKQRTMLKNRMKNDNDYFNSGVMIFNLKKIKGKHTFDTYLEIMKKWNFDMSAFDQDVLNYAHAGYVKYMSWEKYDLFSKFAYLDGWDYEKVKKENSIIHYAGDKPWSFKNFHYELERFWWDYAALTPIYDMLMEKFIEEAMTNDRIEKEIKRITEEKMLYERAIDDAERLLERVNKG